MYCYVRPEAAAFTTGESFARVMRSDVIGRPTSGHAVSIYDLDLVGGSLWAVL
jgi:hypothetical protein